VGNPMSKIIYASLEATIYVWLGKLDLSTEPKDKKLKVFNSKVTQKIKEVYPNNKYNKVKEKLNHLKEYWIYVFEREL
jgi:hypothetical protein